MICIWLDLISYGDNGCSSWFVLKTAYTRCCVLNLNDKIPHKSETNKRLLKYYGEIDED